ncbi:MAG: hypothetical protein WCD42_07830 [Rhizomicrobium sp.]
MPVIATPGRYTLLLLLCLLCPCGPALAQEAWNPLPAPACLKADATTGKAACQVALKDLRAAVAAHPKDATFRFALAVAELRAGEVNQGESDAAAALSLQDSIEGLLIRDGIIIDVNNPQMDALFAADQADRAPGTKWTEETSLRVYQQDQARRGQTRTMLQQHQLHSGDDFVHAAFIFQHGETPADYMLAHILAMTAMTRGNASDSHGQTAAWIAAATLDRYLLETKQKQIFGTQFGTKKDTSEMEFSPADLNQIPDDIRWTFGVPSQAEQLKMLRKLNYSDGKDDKK